ncbi:hypothetical protein F5B18DRAFT_607227 [Nemania serpens]|nr:hypothetical protein F5B18DRAFT_607227 [Nemania serpens]
MIALSNDDISNLGKKINSLPSPYPPVRNVAEVGHVECSIIVLTSSTIIQGTLIPGKVAFRGSRTRQFERLVQIVLELELFDGDCGSPVIDRATRSLYGHIVRGVAGTNVAYIVQVVDIFRDIGTKTGEYISIVTGDDVKDMSSFLNESPTWASWIRCRNMSPDSSRLSTRQHSISRTDILHPSTRTHRPCSASSISQYSASNSVFSRTGALSVATAMSRASEDTPQDAATGSLPCEFVSYSKCEQIFDIDDFDSWIEHIVSVHLRYKLPKTCICWFCDDEVFNSKNGSRELNFRRRMWHIRDHILRQGLTPHNIRPDHHLNKHLWENKAYTGRCILRRKKICGSRPGELDTSARCCTL